MTDETSEVVEDSKYPPIMVSQRELSARMKLTTRWIYDLTGLGIFVQHPGKLYDLDHSYEAYRLYKLEKESEKRAPSVGDGLQKAKQDLIDRRLAREARELIPLSDALATFDIVTGHFLEAISGLPARVTRNIGERKRIEAICDAVRNKLSDLFGTERKALQSGIPAGEAVDEDDA